MNTNTLKKEIYNQLDNASDELLEKIYHLITSDNATIVAYTTDNKPLTLQEYNERLQQGSNDIQLGNYMSTKSLKKEIENWQK